MASKNVPLVAVRGLSVAYGSRTVLENIDLNVETGEIVTLIGPNGAGKTTLIQAIGVAEQNTNGKAMEAEIDEDRGGIHYEVTVLVGDDTREVEVDGNTGEVLKTER